MPENADMIEASSPAAAAAFPRASGVSAAQKVDALVIQDIVLIDNRTLICDCLKVALMSLNRNRVISFPTVKKWFDAAERHSPGAIMVSLRTSLLDAEIQRTLNALLTVARPVPVILLCDVEEPDQIIQVLRSGIAGCILTSIPLEVAAQAIRLVLAGGVFVPASSLIASRLAPGTSPSSRKSVKSLLTPRQTAVLESLCRGKTNREIAGLLNMRESTVKVHVRNVMKRLGAKNRTEVAFIAKKLIRGSGGSRSKSM